MRDDDTKEIDFLGGEYTFFKFNEEMVVEEDLEDEEDTGFEFFV